MVVRSPIWKNTSFVMPRPSVVATAPRTPIGTTSITEKGIDQLSYRAARHRKTSRMASKRVCTTEVIDALTTGELSRG